MIRRRRSLLVASMNIEGSNGALVNIDNYLTIEALEDGLTVSLSTNACEYCVDGDGNWKSLTAGTATESINTGHTLSFRGELTPITQGVNQGIGNFTISKKCNLKGNCMSMLFGDNAVNNYNLSNKRSAFYQLFYKCSNIVTVSSGFLPAIILAPNCYHSMFEKCTSLTTAPELPATTLADSCYYNMFYDCINLTTAPELPVTTLAVWCYAHMFYGCTSLTTAPELPATTLKMYCYYNMFYRCTQLNYIKMLATYISSSTCLMNWVNGVSTTGTFVKNINMLSLPTGESGIPSGWTVVDDEETSIFPMYLNTTYDSSRGLYYRDEDDLSRSLWEWIEQNREKYPDGMRNEDYIPYTIMSQCELYIDDVKVDDLFTDGPGSDNYWNWSPMNSKYDNLNFEPKRILEGGRIEIWED